MGMVHERLPPSVQHGDEADVGTEMLRVGSDGLEGVGGRREQQAVEFALVLQRQRGELGRQGEHDVELRDRQQIVAAILQPGGALVSLALRTVAVAAGVVRDAHFATGIAGIDVAAELGGAAGCQIVEDALLSGRHPVETGKVSDPPSAFIATPGRHS